MISIAAHLYFSKMSNRVSCGSRSDISAFDVSDDYQSFFMTVIHGLLKRLQSLDSKLLIHSDLWLYRRNQIIGCIHDSFIVLPDCLCSSLQGLPILCKCFFCNVFRHIRKHRV